MKKFNALSFSQKQDDGSNVITQFVIDDRCSDWLGKSSILTQKEGETKVKVEGVHYTPLLVLNVSERFDANECRGIAKLLLTTLNGVPKNASLDEVADAFKEVKDD